MTAKEAKDSIPRITEGLKVAFLFLDKGLGMASRRPGTKEVAIWSTIDEQEAKILATSLAEAGQRSRIAAIASRQIVRDYQKYMWGIIAGPRLGLTVKHVVQNILFVKEN